VKRERLIVITISIIGMIFLYRLSPMGYTTRLLSAIKANDEKRVERLVNQNGDLNRRNKIQIAEYWGYTPLQQACIIGNINIIRLLG